MKLALRLDLPFIVTYAWQGTSSAVSVLLLVILYI